MINNLNQLKKKLIRCLKQEDICCFSNQHCNLTKSIKNTSSIILWIKKQLILKSSHFLKFNERKLMHLCFLSADNDYWNHTSFDLTDKIWFWERWMKTQVIINNECTFLDMINTEYVKTWKLNIQKLKWLTSAREFNEKVSWIMHYVKIKLYFNRHVEYISLYLHDLKKKYDMILRH